MLNLIFDLDDTLIKSKKIYNNFSKKYIIGSDFFYINFKTKKNKTIKNKKSKKSKTKNNKIIWNKNYFIIFERNNLRKFLKFCFKHFNVGFWTNGYLKYGRAIIKQLLTPKEIKKCICLIYRTKIDDDYYYYKNDITKKKFKIKKTNGNGSKKLEYVYNKNITKNNTILLDDAFYNKDINYNNTILVPPFNYELINDDYLLKLMKYLNKIKKNKKIGNLNKIQNKLFK